MNLVPADAPKDVYSDIVELVEQERQKDADGDGEFAAIAKTLEGFVERKVCDLPSLYSVSSLALLRAELFALRWGLSNTTPEVVMVYSHQLILGYNKAFLERRQAGWWTLIATLLSAFVDPSELFLTPID